MKNITHYSVWCIVAAVLLIAACATGEPVGYNIEEYNFDGSWELVWEDDFSQDTIDPENWDYDLGDGSIHGIPGWGNDELQYYTDSEENAFIRDGKLVIRAINESRSDSLGSGTYTSARLVTRGKQSWTFGRIEARISLPTGQGLWPAFWMLPEHYRGHATGAYGGWAASGEIDVMEARGSEPGYTTGAVHFGGEWPHNVYRTDKHALPDGTTIEDFHEYAVEWEPDEIRWYFNGEHFFTVTADEWYSMRDMDSDYPSPAPFDQPFHLLLNLAVGGHFDGEPPEDADYFPAEVEVDYVRVYQRQ